MTTEAMKQALEALKMCRGLIRNNIAEGVAISSPNPFFSADVDNAITTLRTAIAEAEKQSAEERSSVERGEPVAVVSGYYGGQCVVLPTNPARLFNSGTAFYTTPPAAPVQEPVAWTARELELIDGMIRVQLDHAERCDSIANRTMADKQKGWDMERVALLQKIRATPPAAQPAPVQKLQLALEALAPLENLFKQAEEKDLLTAANIDCQIATSDLRKAAYAAADMRAGLIATTPSSAQSAPAQEPVVWRDCSTCKYNEWPFGMCEGCSKFVNWEPADATPPAAPVQEPSIPEGWERRTVVGFDALVEALDYAERKGFMPDYIADAWEGFNYLAAKKHAQPAQPAPVQEPDLTEIPMIMTCTKCGAFGEAMLTLETQPAQKPVNVTSKMVQAFLYAAGRHFPWGGSDPAIEDGIKAALEAMPTPPAAQRQSARSAWVGLTDEERRACAESPFVWENFLAIEAKLKEKNA